MRKYDKSEGWIERGRNLLSSLYFRLLLLNALRKLLIGSLNFQFWNILVVSCNYMHVCFYCDLLFCTHFFLLLILVELNIENWKMSLFPIVCDDHHFPCVCLWSGVWWPGPDHTYDVSNHTGHNLSSSGRFLLRSLIPSYQAVCCPLASPQNRFPSLYWGRECEGRAKPPGAGSGRRYILFFSRIPIKISFLFGGDFFQLIFQYNARNQTEERTGVLKIIWHVWQFHMSKYW